MPQLFIDYSGNIKKLDRKKLMLGVNKALFDTGLVEHEFDIKTRIKKVSNYLVGFGDNNQAFIFVRLQALSGRTKAQKNTMTSQIVEYLQSFEDYSAKGLQIQLCVEFTEMPRDIYKKEYIQK